MRVLAYTCPWPGNIVNCLVVYVMIHFLLIFLFIIYKNFLVSSTADHPKSDEYYADPRLAVYAVPFAGLSGYALFILCSRFVHDPLLEFQCGFDKV